jgi:D-glycero-D-manno-heptose 1,7-bisphosphate phosphatase
MISHAVILCGGAGTRMRDFGYLVPKFLLPVGGETVAYYCLKNLADHGIKSVHLLLGIDSEEILDKVQDHVRNFDIKLTYTVEDSPRGTGGALLAALDDLPEKFLLLHGDLLINTDLDEILKCLDSSEYDFAQTVHPSNHIFDSDLVDIDFQMNIRKYFTKPHSAPLVLRNNGNAGIYAFKKKTLLNFKHPKNDKLDLDRELLPRILSEGMKGTAIRNRQFIKDIGTPERFEKALKNFQFFIDAREPRPAIFLDRDGTINELAGHITNREQISILEGVPEAILRINQAGYLAIIVTNQPVISRGEVTREELNFIHAFIEMQIAKVGAVIDEIYYCPHHPDLGYEGEIEELKIECECRKPKPGLLMRACSEFSIDVEKSWMIGDSWRDVTLGDNFGINSLRVGSGIDSNLDFDFENLAEAINYIFT